MGEIRIAIRMRKGKSRDCLRRSLREGASKASDQTPCGLFLFYSNPSLMQAWLGLFIKQKPAAIAAGLI